MGHNNTNVYLVDDKPGRLCHIAELVRLMNECADDDMAPFRDGFSALWEFGHGLTLHRLWQEMRGNGDWSPFYEERDAAIHRFWGKDDIADFLLHAVQDANAVTLLDLSLGVKSHAIYRQVVSRLNQNTNNKLQPSMSDAILERAEQFEKGQSAENTELGNLLLAVAIAFDATIVLTTRHTSGLHRSMRSDRIIQFDPFMTDADVAAYPKWGGVEKQLRKEAERIVEHVKKSRNQKRFHDDFRINEVLRIFSKGEADSFLPDKDPGGLGPNQPTKQDETERFWAHGLIEPGKPHFNFIRDWLDLDEHFKDDHSLKGLFALQRCDAPPCSLGKWYGPRARRTYRVKTDALKSLLTKLDITPYSLIPPDRKAWTMPIVPAVPFFTALRHFLTELEGEEGKHRRHQSIVLRAFGQGLDVYYDLRIILSEQQKSGVQEESIYPYGLAKVYCQKLRRPESMEGLSEALDRILWCHTPAIKVNDNWTLLFQHGHQIRGRSSQGDHSRDLPVPCCGMHFTPGVVHLVWKHPKE